jgi:uncharacterized membrane protein (UPF0127 family)
MKLFCSLIALFLHTAKLQIENHTIQVEVAQTSLERERGLMERSSLSDGEGMLFVYEEPSFLIFWMKNTYIPLSIGFFNEDKVLVGILDMDPPEKGVSTLPIYKSPSPAQYALEVPQGWFQRNKIEPGAKFSLHDLK